MKRIIPILAAVLLLCSPAYAELKAVVSGPNKLKADIEYTLSAKRSTDAIRYEWSVVERPEYDLGAFTWDDDRLVSVMFDEPGEYTIRLKVTGKPDVFPGEKMLPSGPYNPAYVVWLEDRVYGDVKVITESVVDHKVVVGDPKPDPTPPGPTPDPKLSVRVIILTEQEEPHKVPPQQAAAMSAAKVLETLNAKCPKELAADGKQAPAWRILDDDLSTTDLSLLPTGFKDLYGRGVSDAKGQVPWVIATSPLKGTVSRPFPATVEEAVSFFQSL